MNQARLSLSLSPGNPICPILFLRISPNRKFSPPTLLYHDARINILFWPEAGARRPVWPCTRKLLGLIACAIEAARAVNNGSYLIAVFCTSSGIIVHPHPDSCIIQYEVLPTRAACDVWFAEGESDERLEYFH